MSNKKQQKSNVEYLRDYIAGNDEANEFLNAIESELSQKDEEISSLESDNHFNDLKINDLENEIETLEEEKEYEDTIDTKMGTKEAIRWQAPNQACKTMMEELDNAISRGVPLLKIENVLRAL